jgi:hypothetical protein
MRRIEAGGTEGKLLHKPQHSPSLCEYYTGSNGYAEFSMATRNYALFTLAF